MMRLRAPVTVATVSIWVTALVAGIAGAQPKPPLAPPQPVNPTVLPVASAHNLLKNVPPLTPAARAKLLAKVKPTVTERDLSAPFHLDLRTPYLGPKTYLEIVGLTNVLPQFDPPEIRLFNQGGFDSSATLVFPAEANMMYLVDCLVRTDSSPAGHFKTQLLAGHGFDNASVSPPSDNHLTAVVRPDPQPRDIRFTISSDMPNVLLGTCEITPAH